ncbi:MAG: alpha/beta fold hydrolase [Novosphingobium sp.]
MRRMMFTVALCAGLGLPHAGLSQAAPIITQPSAAKPYLTLDQLRKTYTDKDSRFFMVGGLKIHYKDEGPRKGPALLMVHGSESSLRTWDVIAAKLKARYRIIRLDLPGYGLSDGPTDESLKTLVPTDVPIALLDHLQVRTVTFAGVSSGGTMGMYMAARRPDMIERLILSNTPSDPVDTSHLKLSTGLKAAMDRAQQTGFRDQDFWTNFLTFFAGDPARISARTQKEYYDFYRRVPEKNLIGLIARIGDGKQATIEMAKVRKPVLLLWGTADPLLPESALNAIGRYLSNAQISRVSMPDVGHYPPLEVPERIAQLIAAYIEAATPNLPAGSPAVP